MKAVVERKIQTSEYTVGVLTFGGHKLYTLELPWVNNQRNISCIPHGIYNVSPHAWNGEAVKFPRTYEIENVINRSSILIHKGNWTKDTEGCLLIGTGVTIDEDVVMVTQSAKALELFQQFFGRNSFELEIKDV